MGGEALQGEWMTGNFVYLLLKPLKLSDSGSQVETEDIPPKRNFLSLKIDRLNDPFFVAGKASYYFFSATFYSIRGHAA